MPKAIEGARDSILAAARRLLAEMGYDRLTMRSIARACGMATGTLYRYYRAKDELVFSLMEEDWKQMDSALEAIAGDAVDGAAGQNGSRADPLSDKREEDSVESLLRFFIALHEFSSRYAQVWMLMASAPAEEKSPILGTYRADYYRDRLAFLLLRIMDANRRAAALDHASSGSAGSDSLESAATLARVFSLLALDKNPDLAMVRLISRKFLAE
jgi:AcrR family transcriptional regulator